jgi:hypothetical protein
VHQLGCCFKQRVGNDAKLGLEGPGSHQPAVQQAVAESGRASGACSNVSKTVSKVWMQRCVGVLLISHYADNPSNMNCKNVWWNDLCWRC